jgi:hypothetical protein
MLILQTHTVCPLYLFYSQRKWNNEINHYSAGSRLLNERLYYSTTSSLSQWIQYRNEIVENTSRQVWKQKHLTVNSSGMAMAKKKKENRGVVKSIMSVSCYIIHSRGRLLTRSFHVRLVCTKYLQIIKSLLNRNFIHSFRAITSNHHYWEWAYSLSGAKFFPNVLNLLSTVFSKQNEINF